MRTRLKICGFTQVDDALMAANLGVDAIGLVFYPPSPRCVNIEQAIKIVKSLPAFVTIVGLFVDETEARIKEVLAQISIDCLQFHGNEAAADCRLYNKPYIKAVSMRAGLDIENLATHYHDAAAILLDAYHPDMKGGSGHCFDWDLIPSDYPLPIILAGGLQVDNARQAIKTVHPYALDVSTGVEQQKGIKDADKMTALIQAINEGDR